MLFGGFKESKQEPDWIVELPEDDHWAMGILLNAIHANFSRVPKDMDTPGLYEITVQANKYDMTHCLQPWASVWASETNNPDLYEYMGTRAVEETDIQKLWVLHEFGMYWPFETLLLDIALNATATSDGDIQILVTETDGGPPKQALLHLGDTEALIDGRVLGKFNISDHLDSSHAGAGASWGI